MDSLSSLAFCVAGFWALVSQRTRPAGTLERPIVGARSAALVVLGAASFVYHGSLTFLGQVLDVAGMDLVGTVLGLGALRRRGSLGLGRAAGLFVLANLLLGLVQYVVPDARRVLFAVVLVPGMVLEMSPRTTGRHRGTWGSGPLRWGLGLLVIAYGAWLLDQSGTWFEPTSWLQGHAVWHVMGALGAASLVLHYRRTEHPSDVPAGLGTGR